MAVWNNTEINGIIAVKRIIYISDERLRLASYSSIGNQSDNLQGLSIGDPKVAMELRGKFIVLDNNMYGTTEPTNSNGIEGQVYFKIIN